MIRVLLLAGVIWGAGHVLHVPRQARWLMLGLLYVLVLMVQVALPDGHPLRAATGGSAVAWLTLGGAGVLVWGYRMWLSGLRRRAAQPAAEAPTKPGAFGSAELDRYARHIVLREIGGPGQRKLRAARVLVVGAGGLGSPALLYLGAAGVGTIGVIDDDAVANTDLQRQIIHADARIGTPKVFSAATAVGALNPHVTVRPYHRRLTDDIARELFADYDLVLDGSDNFATRYLVNAAAVATGTPLVAAAITQWEGQISLYDPARGAPCYACVFPEAPAEGLAPACAEAGVVGALPGVLGAMMATEAIKEITGAGRSLRGRMLLYDALWSENRTVGLRRRADCPVCAHPPAG